ncbi:MAG: glycine cleavage system protein GcvH [Bdellovibrionales bacterium]|nr:glycine cleavage system protein GcvH [Bdellovibrionales bacterium]
MNTPKDCKYTREHEWAKAEADRVRIGITDYAQQELGDIVFVELPTVGKQVRKGEAFATVESVKAVSEVYAPLDGTVVEANESLADLPETLNKAPHADGWMIVIEPSDTAQLEELMESSEYDSFIEELAK